MTYTLIYKGPEVPPFHPVTLLRNYANRCVKKLEPALVSQHGQELFLRMMGVAARNYVLSAKTILDDKVHATFTPDLPASASLEVRLITATKTVQILWEHQ